MESQIPSSKKEELESRRVSLLVEISRLKLELGQVDDSLKLHKPNAFEALKRSPQSFIDSEIECINAEAASAIVMGEESSASEEETSETRNSRDAKKRGPYHQYKKAFKERVMNMIKTVGIAEAIKKIDKVPENTLRRWSKKDSAERKIGSGRPVKDKTFDEFLFEWIRDKRAKSLKVSIKNFLLYARRLAIERMINLKLTRGWWQKFKVRHKLSLRRKTGTLSKKSEVLEKKAASFATIPQ